MEKLSLEEVIKATNGKLLYDDKYSDVFITSVSVNSKDIFENTLFVPIVGERIDAHKFIPTVVNSGAVAVISSRKDIDKLNIPIILVDDTRLALQDLATYYRDKFDIPIIGITGSVGKTSTKEMVYSALSKKLVVLKTYANQNSQIGLPLTMFNIKKNHDAAVIEMGMSQFGEMSKLAKIAKPTCAAITNIGISHIENLNSTENILKEKFHITDCMTKGDTLYINGDDKLLNTLKQDNKLRIVTFGFSNECDFYPTNIKVNQEITEFDLKLDDINRHITINAVGKHNILNALCAIAIGTDLGINIDIIIEGIASYKSPKMRQEIYHTKGYIVIDDSYNASPDSMKSGIDVLNMTAGSGKKILVCADMLELGTYAKKAHFDLGVYAANNDIDCIISIGELAENIALGAKETNDNIDICICDTNAEAYDYIKSIIQEDDAILVKGSRGMKTDEIVKCLIEE